MDKKITNEDLLYQIQKAESYAEGYKQGYSAAMQHTSQLLKAVEEANNAKADMEADKVSAKAPK